MGFMIQALSAPFAGYPKVSQVKSFTAMLEKNQVLNRVVLDVLDGVGQESFLLGIIMSALKSLLILGAGSLQV